VAEEEVRRRDQYCINAAQREEWVKLHAIDEIKGDSTSPGYSVPLTPEFIKAHPTLMVDTRHFANDAAVRLMEQVGEIDAQADGLLVHADNYQALSTCCARHSGTMKCIYIDPPYNTDAGPIDYKNGYRSSSWMSMIQSRLSASRRLLSDDGILCVTIDDYQVHELASLLDAEFGRFNQLGTAVIRNNASGRPSVTGLSVCHEYGLFYSMGGAALNKLPRTQEQLDRFSEEDGTLVNWQPFRKGGGAVTYRVARPKQYYPVYVNSTALSLRIPTLEWNKTERSWTILQEPTSDETVVWPIDEKGQERIWSYNHTSAIENMADLQVRIADDGSPQIYRKHRPADGVSPRSWWDKTTYGAREYGSAVLANLFGASPFSFAKSPYAVEDSLRVAGVFSDQDSSILDYFAGSGTTGHAVINLNREDGGQRKFILVEMGDYFDTVLLPRLKKVTFTPEWKDGKPKRLATTEEAERSPRIMKVLRLESYEDALNNLELRRTEAQDQLLLAPETQGADGLKEQYLLKYQLEVESRGSPSLLNIRAFADPTAYKLKVKRPGSDETREVNVDLLETFNWLIGLTVQHLAAPQTFAADFERDTEGRLQIKGRLRSITPPLQHATTPAFWLRTITGTDPEKRKVLVIWRKLTGNAEQDNLVLDTWFTKQGYSAKDSEFDLIYVNGDNNLENLKAADDTWKVRLIEEDFHRLMFAEEG
jgi:adenine-specific DNA-methyltransferase